MKFSGNFLKVFANLALACLFLQSCAMGMEKKPSLPVVSRMDPPFWWVGMKNTTLEVIFSGKNISSYAIELKDSPTRIVKITRPSNPDYVFVELEIKKEQQAGKLEFLFSTPKSKPKSVFYELKKREGDHSHGLSSSDLIYLVFPDRFSNGDPSNDAIAGMNEPTIDRKMGKSRHGGDIQGIINHLDYIDELGATSVWVNPVLENNQPHDSYHGYAFTDHYKVDPRLGNNELFCTLVDSLHKRKMKLVWDVVYNHIGSEHYLMKNLPDSSWVNWFPVFTRTSYRAETLMDPYASDFDKKIMSDGWFDHHMPDLNQRDPHLATYLIQNSIWWIEYAGIDAFRIDTYAYPDQLFMKKLNEAVLKEYPDFTLFGETWVQGSPVQAWFTGGHHMNQDYSSSLQGVTDFQLYFAITNGLNEDFGWENGFRRIELTLSHDILYEDPYRNVTHLDNHDLGRFYSMVKEDFTKWKMGIAMLYTLRGIPQVYYGTEILMKNYADPDSKVREDFPGGWQGDAVNKFKSEGRNAQENEAFEFCKKLGNFRRDNEWFGASRLKQFVPEENTYVYFRYDDEHTVMCIYNGSAAERSLNMGRFAESTKGFTKGVDIVSGNEITLGESMMLPPKSVTLVLLKN